MIERAAPVARVALARSPVAACMARFSVCLPCVAVVCTIALVAVLVAAVARCTLALNARVELIARLIDRTCATLAVNATRTPTVRLFVIERVNVPICPIAPVNAR